jgi:endonuclease YncB( thermonuclease family)
LEDLEVDGKVISPWIFKKYDERALPVFVWLKNVEPWLVDVGIAINVLG